VLLGQTRQRLEHRFVMFRRRMVAPFDTALPFGGQFDRRMFHLLESHTVSVTGNRRLQATCFGRPITQSAPVEAVRIFYGNGSHRQAQRTSTARSFGTVPKCGGRIRIVKGKALRTVGRVHFSDGGRGLAINRRRQSPRRRCVVTQGEGSGMLLMIHIQDEGSRIVAVHHGCMISSTLSPSEHQKSGLSPNAETVHCVIELLAVSATAFTSTRHRDC
jgi:hypothetical protein